MKATYSAVCDTCDKNLSVGADWFHKPNSDSDLCQAHHQQLAEDERMLYINIDATSKLGDEAKDCADEAFYLF